MRRGQDWNEGDRVLAPWEPQWLYPATISGIDGDVALIMFDDGDHAHVPLLQLRPLVLSEGDEVHARRDRTVLLYYPAQVLSCSEEELQVRYADGHLDSLEVGYVRVRAPQLEMSHPDGQIAAHEFAIETDNQAGSTGQDWEEGDRVLAPWEPQWLYPATISGIDGDVASIMFDDGDHAHVPLSLLQPLVLKDGDEVHARRDRTAMLYYPAQVLSYSDEKLQVRYADGHLDSLAVGYVRVRAPELESSNLNGQAD